MLQKKFPLIEVFRFWTFYGSKPNEFLDLWSEHTVVLDHDAPCIWMHGRLGNQHQIFSCFPVFNTIARRV